jgi:hypothetical protein
MQEITDVSKLEIGKKYYFVNINEHTRTQGIKRIIVYNGCAATSANTIVFTTSAFITRALVDMTFKRIPFLVYALREDYAIYPCIWRVAASRRIFAAIINSVIADVNTVQMLALEFFPD